MMRGEEKERKGKEKQKHRKRQRERESDKEYAFSFKRKEDRVRSLIWAWRKKPNFFGLTVLQNARSTWKYSLLFEIFYPTLNAFSKHMVICIYNKN